MAFDPHTEREPEEPRAWGRPEDGPAPAAGGPEPAAAEGEGADGGGPDGGDAAPGAYERPDAAENGPEAAGGPEPEAPEDQALGVLREERDRYLDALQRLKADFDNYRKRTERDRQALASTTARELLTELLPVVDNLERAAAALPKPAGERPEADAGLAAGVDMVLAQLTGVLSRRGIAAIDPLGEPFDPTVHEAVLSQPSEEHADGTVMAVVQKGYRQEDAVLRPARVVVAAAG